MKNRIFNEQERRRQEERQAWADALDEETQTNEQPETLVWARAQMKQLIQQELEDQFLLVWINNWLEKAYYDMPAKEVYE